MNHENARITGYLLIMKGADWDQQISDNELQSVVDRTTKWFDALMKQGKVAGGNALLRRGVIISGKGGKMVTDGPFTETKEVIGGYLLLKVDTFEDAVAIAKTSPGLDHGITIEVRPVTDECPVFKRVRERLGLATRTF
jgi:hypothetical protein